MFSNLSFYNYRNLADCTVSINSSKVQIIGPNGSGKTNFLSGVYFLCYGTPSIISSSFLSSKQKENIANVNSKEASISGIFLNENEQESVKIKYQNNEKKIFVNDEKIQDRAVLFENKSCIHFSTFDSMLMKNPTFCRRLFDQSMSLSYLGYIDDIRKYQRILKNRNITLKENDKNLLDIFTNELSKLTLKITQNRRLFIDEFNIILDKISKNFTNKKLFVRYEPNISVNDLQGVINIYNKSIDSDIKFGITSKGVHRDKYIFLQDNIDYFSQGELKLFSILIKLVQKDIIYKNSYKKSILIFDDALVDLDKEKSSLIYNYFQNTDSVFFSFSNSDLSIKDNQTQTIYIENGNITF